MKGNFITHITKKNNVKAAFLCQRISLDSLFGNDYFNETKKNTVKSAFLSKNAGLTVFLNIFN